MKVYNKIVNKCIKYTQDKQYGINIKNKTITVSSFPNLTGEKIVKEIEEIIFQEINKKETNIDKYFISNDIETVSVKMYIKE